MNLKGKLLKVCFFIIVLVYNLKASNFYFGSTDSTVHLTSGANFLIENPILGVDGAIIKESDASIGGAQITFDNGVFAESNNKVRLSGVVDFSVDSGIFLDGDKQFTGKTGKLTQPIYVSRKGNKIDGNSTLVKDITLEDVTTSVSIDILTNLKSNVNLNGGDLYIVENNLMFDDGKKIVGPGKVFLNGNKLVFGAKSLTFDQPLYFVDAGDISFNDLIMLATDWTLSGNCILEGSNNMLCLSGGGKIIVERGSSLLLKNFVLHGVRADSLFCMDNSSTISFQNVDVYFDSDYTFSIGHFDVLNDVYFCGSHKYTYYTPKQSSITSKASLYLEGGMTFSYDAAQKDLLVFQDQSSNLILDGVTLHATFTGMQLKSGTLVVAHNSYLSTEKNDLVDEGITFGNDVSEEDLCCKILNGSKLEVIHGSLKYRNIDASSWFMENSLSLLQIDWNCNLYLYQNLDLGLGTLNYQGQGGFFRAPGKNLSGTFNVVNYLDYRTI